MTYLERLILLNKEVMGGHAKLYVKPQAIDAICERQQGNHSFILVSGQWIAVKETVKEVELIILDLNGVP